MPRLKHVAPETLCSIPEGGELGYALSHDYGAAFDNSDVIVTCIVGDGDAETGPPATAWHGNKFLNPEREGNVLPISDGRDDGLLLWSRFRSIQPLERNDRGMELWILSQ